MSAFQQIKNFLSDVFSMESQANSNKKLDIGYFSRDGISGVPLDNPGEIIELFVNYWNDEGNRPQTARRIRNQILNSLSNKISDHGDRKLNDNHEINYESAEFRRSESELQRKFTSGLKNQAKDDETQFLMVSLADPTWSGTIHDVERIEPANDEGSEISTGIHESHTDGKQTDQIDDETWFKTDSIYETFDCILYDQSLRMVVGREVNKKTGLQTAVADDFKDSDQQTIYGLETDFGWLPVIDYITIWMLMDESPVEQTQRIKSYLRPVENIETDTEQQTVNIGSEMNEPQPISTLRQDSSKQLIYNDNSQVEALIDTENSTIITSKPNRYEEQLKCEATEGISQGSSELIKLSDIAKDERETD